MNDERPHLNVVPTRHEYADPPAWQITAAAGAVVAVLAAGAAVWALAGWALWKALT